MIFTECPACDEPRRTYAMQAENTGHGSEAVPVLNASTAAGKGLPSNDASSTVRKNQTSTSKPRGIFTTPRRVTEVLSTLAPKDITQSKVRQDFQDLVIQEI